MFGKVVMLTAVAAATLLTGCSQLVQTPAASNASLGSSRQSAEMDEIVVTASRHSGPTN